MSAILVIYIYAGMLAKGDSVAINSIPMPNVQICEREAVKTKQLVKNTTKEIITVCLNVSP